MVPVITIDGTSGCGKGTLAHRLSRYFSYHYLDSGALYRIVAWASDYYGVPYEDTQAFHDFVLSLDIAFKDSTTLDGFEVWCNDQNVSTEIRTQACGQRASKVSALPVVRKALLSLQHGFQKAPGLVTDGRDMGTVVFADAKCKFFLTASLEVRAKRRYQQIIARGDEADLTVIEQELALRDQRDQERVISALKPAADAIIVDTSAMDIDAVFELALGYIE